MFAAALLFDIGTTLNALRGIDVAEEEADVPPVAQLLLNNAKAELRDLAASILRDEPPEAPLAAADLRRVMRWRLAMQNAFEECDSRYGTIYEPEITAPADDLIAVEVTFAIPCGSDSVLFLFRYEDGWRLVLDWERNDFARVQEANGWFAWHVSMPDVHGSFLVVTSDISTSCNSNWQWLRWRVDRVNRGGRQAEKIAEGEDQVYVGNDDFLETEVTPNGFCVRYDTGSADLGRLVRNRRLDYRVDGRGDITRLEPVASTPRDFLDEWLKEHNDERRGEIDEPLRCDDGTWQVALTSYENDDADETITYFFVAEENGMFRMVASRDKPCR